MDGNEEHVTSVAAVPLAAVERFDHEADVLVVGFGCAGAAAAVEAAAAGADVLLLERLSGPGGSSAQSGGEIYLGGGTAVQKACGFDDSADDMYAYLHAALGPHVDEAKLRLSVVLTTGGFIDNDDMLADHAAILLGHGKVSDGGDDGSGILMAVALGAATRRMAVVEAAIPVPPALACDGILVNALGQRFINEDVYPGLYSHAALFQPEPWWIIIDGERFEAIAAAEAPGLQPQHAAQTAAELGAELGMPPGALEATVAAYSRHAADGEDPYFHKDARWLRALTGPLAAVDPRAYGSLIGMPTGIAGFTLGGLHTTVDGAVLHVSGRPVPRLYAAGRAASGIHGDGYVSGTSLGDGTFFGRRAGRAAAS